MSISSINYGNSVLGQSVRNIQNQLSDLSTQLSTGVKSTNYAGMGVNEGFAIAARTQLANLSAFGTTMTNVNTIIGAANTALQSLSTISGQVQNNAASTSQNITASGQTIGQQNAESELSAIVGILNTQVGDRNMQNYPLLEAVGEANKPVLLKRGPSATMEEFLLAAEYVLDQGNSQVMLCERGVRTFESHTRFTLPLATVPYLQAKTHLPVVVDPSHGTGIANLVPPMCTAAIAAGCDGLIVEVHPNPSQALSDGAQSLTPAQFTETMEKCRRVAAAVDRQLS